MGLKQYKGSSEPSPPSVRRPRPGVEGQGRVSVPPARAFWFGPTERPLFGWYHAPAQQPARGAVVLCNAFGHEAMVSHRANRRLAQRLAAEGYAVQRFDYDGTGDSAGADDDPGRVAAWLQSIECAITEVVALSGASKVVLIGTRLGALLATFLAQRSMVDSLVLIAPPRSGAAWLREMRVLQAMKRAGQTSVEGVTSEAAVAGFVLTDSTRLDLGQLDLSALVERPALNALVVARDDLPGGERELVAHLSSLGVNAHLSLAPGYSASMPEDPFKAVLPVQIFEAIVTWLDGLALPTPRSAEPKYFDPGSPVSTRPSVTTMALPTPTTREQVADIGGLFAIMTEPSLPSAQTRTAVILLNIGANHHVGSNRMYVRMARAWAEQGFQVLRMDFSGMGDSPPPDGGNENEVYAARFMAEARAGIDFARGQGATRFVLMGLCSGAYVAYHTAIADPRVDGVVMINPLTFHWNEGDSLEIRIRESFKSTQEYKRTLFRKETWLRIARGEVGVAAIAGELTRRVQRRTAREARSLAAKLRGDIAEATDIQRGFRQLCARGTECLLVFGAEDGGIDLIEGHLGRNASDMREVSKFRMHIFEGPDHTFTPLWTQARLQQLISDYLMEHHYDGSV